MRRLPRSAGCTGDQPDGRWPRRAIWPTTVMRGDCARAHRRGQALSSSPQRVCVVAFRLPAGGAYPEHHPGLSWYQELRWSDSIPRKIPHRTRRGTAILVSRHCIGEYMPQVVHQVHGPRPSPSAGTCWPSRRRMSHPPRLPWVGRPGRAMDCHYRDSFYEQYSLEKGLDVVTLDHYDAWGRTVNHHMARAARNGLIFPREPGLQVSLHPLPDGLRMAPSLSSIRSRQCFSR